VTIVQLEATLDQIAAKARPRTRTAPPLILVNTIIGLLKDDGKFSRLNLVAATLNADKSWNVAISDDEGREIGLGFNLWRDDATRIVQLLTDYLWASWDGDDEGDRFSFWRVSDDEGRENFW
jgi:hypothetical protein